MWCMYLLEYYPPIKKKEILLITWMDLKDIMLSEINQIEKDKYCMILLICGIEKNSQKQTGYLPQVRVGWDGKWVTWVKVIKKVKPFSLNELSPGVMCSMVTIVNNTYNLYKDY